MSRALALACPEPPGVALTAAPPSLRRSGRAGSGPSLRALGCGETALTRCFRHTGCGTAAPPPSSLSSSRASS
eukprot:1796945-Pyramimonas_sp.AAC.1